MKKSNVILQAAIASALLVMAGSASAGSLSAANTVFATQNFTAANATGVALTPGAVNYSTSSSLTVNANTALYFTIRLANGTFAAAPVFGDFKLAGVAALAAPSANQPGAVITMSADKTTIQVAFTTMTGGTTLLGLGAMTWTPSAGNVVASNAVMAVAGGAISETAVLALTATAPANSTAALPATVDAPAATGAIATSASAITAAVDATAGGYTGKIDLTANPVSSLYTAATVPGAVPTNKAMLGAVTFTNVAGANQAPAGTVAYTVAAGSANSAATNAVLTITPGTGQKFPIGATVFASAAPTCAGPIGATAAMTAASAGLAATVTIPTPTAATVYYVCQDAPSAGNVAAPITATIAASLTPAVGTDAPTTATGLGYALNYNGSQVDVRNYVPLAVAGWTQYLRIINTGSVTASVSAQAISDTTGLPVGTPAVIIANMAPGVATTLSSTQIEAAIGAQAATSRPRIRVTAPTNGMDVQNFVFTPNGSFTAAQGTDK